MKTIATVLLVLVAIIGMAGPVLGAEAGTSNWAYADWYDAEQSTFAWAQDDEYTAYPDAYVEAGTYGAAGGWTESGSSASAGNDWAEADTGGYAQGEYYWSGDAYTESYTYAESWDDDAWTYTDTGSYAQGSYVDVDGGAGSYWGYPINSWSWSDAYSSDDWATSGGSAYAEEP